MSAVTIKTLSSTQPNNWIIQEDPHPSEMPALTDTAGDSIVSTASYRLVFEDGGELGLFHIPKKTNFGVALRQHSCAGSVIRYSSEKPQPPRMIGALVPYSDEELPPPWNPSTWRVGDIAYFRGYSLRAVKGEIIQDDRKWLGMDVVGYHELLWTSMAACATGFIGEQDGQFIRLKLQNGDGIRAIQIGDHMRFVKDMLGKDSIRVKFLPVPLEANYPGY